MKPPHIERAQRHQRQWIRAFAVAFVILLCVVLAPAILKTARIVADMEAGQNE